jgi:hypothetical protein
LALAIGGNVTITESSAMTIPEFEHFERAFNELMEEARKAQAKSGSYDAPSMPGTLGRARIH